MARLQDKYRDQIVPELQKELGLDNPMRVPRLKKDYPEYGFGRSGW